MERLYTCEEIADRYYVQIATVWGWIRKKKLPAIKVGKFYRVSEKSLESFENAKD